MQNIFHYPKSLDNKRISDEHMASSYESLSNIQRAYIKNGIAFNHFLHQERMHKQQTIISDISKDFSYSKKTEPVAWTVLFFTSTYSSAPRMIATLMPALLAQVPMVLAISLNGLPCNNALTTLEILGIEDIFSINKHKSLSSHKKEIDNIIKSLKNFNPHGRALFLHNNELCTEVHCAIENNLIFWQEHKPPKIAVQEKCTYTKEYLAWAHADAFCSESNLDYKDAEILFCTKDFYKKNKDKLSNIQLFLFEGMEGCWVHSNLKPEFFQQKTMCIGKPDL